MAADGPDGPGGVEKLSSNVMNYLVWRYLQESGYGKTAKQLQYQWMGREQSPEQLPFATNIKKSCLIHLAQDGLFLDNLQAEVKKVNRQYVFGPDHGRKFSIPAEEPREKKSRMRSTSRIASNSEREMQNGSATEVTAQKRGRGKRKSGGNEKRVNGDAMEVDVGTSTANDTAVPDADSPMPVIEEVPPFSTLEIGESKGTLTEQPRDLTPNTSFVGLEDGLLLEQVKWSPHNRTALVTAGRNHMQVFKVGTNDVPENNTYTISTRVQISADEYDVQACCWTEKGSGAFTTLETFQNESGDELRVYKMLGFTDYGKKITLVDSTAGWVLALKYNHDSEMLLSLSWGEQSHVKIWHYSETIYENSKRRVEPSFQLKASKTLDAMLLAATWISPEQFVVCGSGAIQVYEVGDDIQLIKSVPTDLDWVRLEYDPVYDIVALQDESTQMLSTVNLGAEEPKLQTRMFDYKITDFAFQPLDSKPSPEELAGQPATRVLATAADDGKVYLWNVLNEWTPLQKLSMGWDAVAQSVAFSPDGFLLAAAGYDTLNVWKTLESRDPKCVWRMPHGTNEQWKSEETEQDSSEGRFVHKLGWDADGKRIAFGMNGQVAVIRI